MNLSVLKPILCAIFFAFSYCLWNLMKNLFARAATSWNGILFVPSNTHIISRMIEILYSKLPSIQKISFSKKSLILRVVFTSVSVLSGLYLTKAFLFFTASVESVALILSASLQSSINNMLRSSTSRMWKNYIIMSLNCGFVILRGSSSSKLV